MGLFIQRTPDVGVMLHDDSGNVVVAYSERSLARWHEFAVRIEPCYYLVEDSNRLRLLVSSVGSNIWDHDHVMTQFWSFWYYWTDSAYRDALWPSELHAITRNLKSIADVIRKEFWPIWPAVTEATPFQLQKFLYNEFDAPINRLAVALQSNDATEIEMHAQLLANRTFSIPGHITLTQNWAKKQSVGQALAITTLDPSTIHAAGQVNLLFDRLETVIRRYKRWVAERSAAGNGRIR